MVLEEILLALKLIVDPEKIRVMEEVGSTMDEVKHFLPAEGSGGPKQGFLGVVVALSQRSGRGRQGRKWVSNQGTGVYLSAMFRIKVEDQSSLGLLPLVIGLELKRNLEKYAPDIYLKWPNDLMVQTDSGLKKLGGLLLEATHDAENVTITIGVGINLKKIEFPTSISLEEFSALEPDFADISAIILGSSISAIERLANLDIDDFIESYNFSMLFLNQEVSFSDRVGGELFVGVNRGIDSDGSLLLETSSDTIKLYSGEVHQTKVG